MNIRVGIGYDVHRMVEGRPLVLGGVTVPYHKGLDGHSDADVLVHAIMDALLGAAGLGDIGKHFPDSDPRYRGVSSLYLLAETGAFLSNAGYVPINIDAVLVAQDPKLSPYREEMVSRIAQTLKLEEDAVNIKFTTEEGLGFTGTGLGMSAQAVCLISR